MRPPMTREERRDVLMRILGDAIARWHLTRRTAPLLSAPDRASVSTPGPERPDGGPHR